MIDQAVYTVLVALSPGSAGQIWVQWLALAVIVAAVGVVAVTYDQGEGR